MINFTKKTLVLATTLSLLGLGLVACTKVEKGADQPIKTVSAQMKPVLTTLYYNGQIKPIKVTNVTSPVDGVVTQLFFHYGENVKVGQKLVMLRSDALQNSYHDALASYLKSKAALNQSKTRFDSTKLLYDAGLVPRNTYHSDQAAVFDSALSFTQAESKINDIAKKLKIKTDTLSRLNLANNFKEVDKELKKQFTEFLVKSPATGIALFPTPKASSSSSKSGGDGAQPGADMKTGAVLLSIGNLNGLSVSFSVNEVDVNQLKAGQKVTVTGPAFPGITLKGKIQRLTSQAKSESLGAGNSPMFPVVVNIPTVPKTASGLIHVGMTTQIKLTIEHPAQISIPVSAVKARPNGTSYVLVQNDPNSKPIEVSVQPGKTDISSIVIKKGLKTGDKVVISH